MAFAGGARFIGCALFADGKPLWLYSRRIRVRDNWLPGVERWTTKIIARWRPVVVATIDDEGLSRDVRDLLRRVIESRNVTSLEVSRSEIARALELGHASNRAVRKQLTERYPLIASYFPTSRGPRSDAARYWEMSTLAAGAAQAALSLIL